MLAQVGRDDGLIPVFSLLGDCAQVCNGEPILATAVAAVRQPIEALLDDAQPFDEQTLGLLRRLVGWLPAALSDGRQGRPIEPFAATAPAAGSTLGARAAAAGNNLGGSRRCRAGPQPRREQ